MLKIKKKTIITKVDATTNPSFGCHPSKRSTKELISYGIVNIDKPRGPTSHQACEYAKNIVKVSKAGHSGTLDPHVTGCLPVAFGNATRISMVMLKSGKEYVGIMHLHKPVEEKVLRKEAKKFIGAIQQLPPIRSSVKRQIRTRHIYSFNLLEIDGQDILFDVSCESGTYIRKLIHDLGQKLGCGAHMAQLRRTRAGCFDESSLVTLQTLHDAMHYYENGDDTFIRKIVQPPEAALCTLAKVWVLDSAVNPLCNGQTLHIPGIAKFEEGIKIGDTVAVLTLKDELIAIGEAIGDARSFINKKGQGVSLKHVFMKPGIYTS